MGGAHLRLGTSSLRVGGDHFSAHWQEWEGLILAHWQEWEGLILWLTGYELEGLIEVGRANLLGVRWAHTVD